MSLNFMPRQSVMALALVIACLPAAAAPSRATPGAPAASGGSPCATVEVGPIVKLSVGKASVLKLQSPVTRILLGNPDNSQAVQPSAGTPNAQNAPGAAPARPQNTAKAGVADIDVLLLSSREVYLLGKTVGSTNLVMLDRAGQCTMLDVVVGMDTAALSATFKELLPGENGIKISSAADSLVLSGTVSDAAAADRAVEIAGAYVRRASGGAQMQGTRAGVQDQIINLMSVAAPQQVMLEVKVAEISKALLDEFGINFSRAYASNGTMRFLSGILGGNSLLTGQLSGMANATVGLGTGSVISNGAGAAAVAAPAGSITATNGAVTEWPIGTGSSATLLGIEAQKQDGLLKILAEPTIMAISGQSGSFNAGGKIFIPVAQTSGGGTAITLEEKPFGVGLKFTPTVLGDGRINLKVDLEVSELSAQGVTITSTNTGGTQILPAFTQRLANTTVQLMDGQSFAVGGLIKNNVTSNLTAFPILGELPIIGALFRSTSFKNDRSELVFVITPHLVKPLPPNYALPTDSYVPPTRSDMILKGRLEGQPSPSAAPAETPVEPVPAAPSNGGFEVK